MAYRLLFVAVWLAIVGLLYAAVHTLGASDFCLLAIYVAVDAWEASGRVA